MGASSAYEACRELFNSYPLAVRAANTSGTILLMVLVVREEHTERFYVLSRDCPDANPRYHLRLWRTRGLATITADDDGVPDVIMNILTCGVPIPQDEFLFGWRDRDQITALVVFYTRYSPESPEPSWAVLPRVGTLETHWPPFTGEAVLGPWFWEHYQVGNIVSVDGIIADNPATVFWVDTQAILGSNCCVVKRDITGPDGLTLRRGRYVYHEAQYTDVPVPSLPALLADACNADLAPRFRRGTA